MNRYSKQGRCKVSIFTVVIAVIVLCVVTVTFAAYDQFSLTLAPSLGAKSPLWLAGLIALVLIVLTFAVARGTSATNDVPNVSLILWVRGLYASIASFVVIGGVYYSVFMFVEKSRTYNNIEELVCNLTESVGQRPRTLKGYLGDPIGNDWKEVPRWFISSELRWDLRRTGKQGNSGEMNVVLWPDRNNLTEGIRIELANGSMLSAREALVLIKLIDEPTVCAEKYSLEPSMIVRGRMRGKEIAIFIRNKTLKYESVDGGWPSDVRAGSGFRWESGSVYQICIGKGGPIGNLYSYVKVFRKDSNKLQAFLGASSNK